MSAQHQERPSRDAETPRPSSGNVPTAVLRLLRRKTCFRARTQHCRLVSLACLACLVCCGGRRPIGLSEAGASDEASSSVADGAAQIDAGVMEADAAADTTPTTALPDSHQSADDATDVAADVAAIDAASDGDAGGLVLDAPSNADAPPMDTGPSDSSGPCGAVIEQHAIEGALHVAVCFRVSYLTKPPSSGSHYPIWAAYKSYASAIPEGFWVHDLEHGAVVLTYNCPGGCAADLAAAQAWIDALPDDPLCVPSPGGARVRTILTPDPNLDTKFAASAWGWTLRANCFDPAPFTAFAQAHYGRGPEAICAQGQDLSSGVQDGCGE